MIELKKCVERVLGIGGSIAMNRNVGGQLPCLFAILPGGYPMPIRLSSSR
jgi:hypothetical protein